MGCVMGQCEKVWSVWGPKTGFLIFIFLILFAPDHSDLDYKLNTYDYTRFRKTTYLKMLVRRSAVVFPSEVYNSQRTTCENLRLLAQKLKTWKNSRKIHHVFMS